MAKTKLDSDLLALNKNLLIGTAVDNGTDKLQVNGGAQIGNVLRVTDGTKFATLGVDVNGQYLEALGANSMRHFTGGAERMRLASSGNLLVGTTVDNGADKLQVAGKANIGTTTVAGVVIVTSPGAILSITPDAASGGNGVTYNTSFVAGGTGPHKFATGGTESMRLDTLGNLLVGTTSGTYHQIRKPSAEGVTVLGVTNGNGGMYVYGAALGGWNAAATVVAVDKNSATNRSINAGGTINASGTDYAEYMRKASNVGDIAKGQVVGITANGEVTDKWADAVSFMVKTTNPSYVGGDSWGAGLEGAALEAARATVDRIAYAGQVPINVQGATPGQFIVPVQAGTGITGVAINEDDLTLKQYIKAVGIVQNILPDGRANIRVKVA